MFKLMDKKIIAILRYNALLNWPYAVQHEKKFYKLGPRLLIYLEQLVYLHFIKKTIGDVFIGSMLSFK